MVLIFENQNTYHANNLGQFKPHVNRQSVRTVCHGSDQSENNIDE